MNTVELKTNKNVARYLVFILAYVLGGSLSWGDEVQFSFNPEVVPLVTESGHCLVPAREFVGVFGEAEVGTQVVHNTAFEKYCSMENAMADVSKSKEYSRVFKMYNYGGVTYLNEGLNYYLVKNNYERSIASEEPFPAYRSLAYAWRLPPAEFSPTNVRTATAGVRKIGVKLVIAGKVLHTETGGVTAISTGKETYWLNVDQRKLAHQPETVQIAVNPSEVLWASIDN